MPCSDEVAPVDAREAARDHRLTPRCSGASAACSRERALAVVVAADDDAAAPLARAVVELRVEAAEHEARARRDVRPHGHADRAVRRHVAGGDVVADDDQHPRVDRRPAAAPARGRDEVRARA